MSNKKKSVESKFSKEALLNSIRFRNERDLISALLTDSVEYTVEEVETKIMEYMKGKVK